MDFNLSFNQSLDSEELFDLIIIGGGPAGLTAGLYAARYKLRTLMIEKMPVSGGQLTATEWVENYPGFPEPVLGRKLAADMETQAKQFGLEIIYETVISVQLDGGIKQITTPYAVWKAKSVLITTGSSSRMLNVPGESDFHGRGVSYCATCDGPFYPDKVVAVVGGGNSAFEEAQFLSKYARQVYLIHRSEHYKADKIYIDRAKGNPKIKLLPYKQVKEVVFHNPDDKKLLISNLQTGEEEHLPVDGLFIFIGSDPNTQLFTGQLEMEQGYLVTDRMHSTSMPGVWAAGDVQAKALRQVATAVGDGACAAFWIHKYIEDWE